ncbi:hypothetical protein IWW47_006119, partial [Coemansia sp. RSA 2052]
MRVLPVFAITAAVLTIAAHPADSQDAEDSDDISRLLGMRPDLAEELDGSEASSSRGSNAVESINEQLA